MMKQCKSCGADKAITDFYANQKAKDLLQEKCKDCHKKAMRLLRLTNPKVQERERLRAKEPSRKLHAAANLKRWRQRNPAACKAQKVLNRAVKDGKVKKDPCFLCGSTAHIHAHHNDYSKPLNVVWLCARCHHRAHSAFRINGHRTYPKGNSL